MTTKDALWLTLGVVFVAGYFALEVQRDQQLEQRQNRLSVHCWRGVEYVDFGTNAIRVRNPDNSLRTCEDPPLERPG